LVRGRFPEVLNGEPVAEPGQWLSTSEVASRLGIKRATVYAYVSRGVLQRIRRPGRRDSWFDLSEIERFASARGSVRNQSLAPPEQAPV
jgi:excisionase family DNA binding protein